MSAAITETNIDHKFGESVTGAMPVTDWYPGPGLQYSAWWNAEKVLNGSPMEEWEPGWNSTWALKNETWTLMDFEEAKALKVGSKSVSDEEEEEEEDEEKKKNDEGKSKFWDWYNGKYTGTRSFG